MILSLDAMEKGVVVSEKDSNGVHLSLVKVNAEVLPNFGKEDKYDGTKSLVFYKLDGTTGLSKLTYKTVPNEYNRHVTVYYVEKNNEKNKHAYTIFFNRNDVLFENQEEVEVSNENSVDSLDEIASEDNTESHIIRDTFQDGGIYLTLFMAFLGLNGFFNGYVVDMIFNKKLNYALQIILILIFLFSGENIIRTENSECYDSPYVTMGKVDYFISEPYVTFIDCYGEKGKSVRKNPELLGKAKNDVVKIYYNHDTRESHGNVYRVYTSRESYKTEIAAHTYFGLFMLFVLIYSYLYKDKKMYAPPSLSTNRSKLYFYSRNPTSFNILLNMVDKEYYKVVSMNRYLIDPIVSTNRDNSIVIERFKLFEVLLPGVIGLGLLWVFLGILWIMYDKGVSAITSDEIVMTILIGILGIAPLYITFKNFTAKKKVGKFNLNARRYEAYLIDKKVLFSEIYGYTITYKHINLDNGRMRLYELDMVLMNGDIVNLYAREIDYKKLLEEAKIIAAYTDKPIYDFGKRDINKIFKNKAYVSDGRD